MIRQNVHHIFNLFLIYWTLVESNILKIDLWKII